jgi:hypothetical protein
VGCLFVVASIASAGLYRANPENAWDLFTIWKKIIPTAPEIKKILLVALAVGMTACSTKTTEVVKDPPLNTNQCEALTGAAYRASSANDPNSAAIFMMVAKRGGCY